LKGCGHADGAPAACLVTGRTRQSALPVDCPVALLCAVRCGAGWLYRHNNVPGTSQ
jgi:hypothetical protein